MAELRSVALVVSLNVKMTVEYDEFLQQIAVPCCNEKRRRAPCELDSICPAVAARGEVEEQPWGDAVASGGSSEERD